MADLRTASIGEIIEFVFDHPPQAHPTADYWWWAKDFEELEDLPHDPARQVEAMRWICAHPEELAMRFSGPQLDQGFWFMFGPGGEHLFLEHLWNADVPWQQRRACIRELGTLHATLFRQAELDGFPFMFWDEVSFGYDCGNRDPARPEDARVQQAIFETLSTLLDAGDSESQFAALHGLGHLCHPRGNERISRFLGQKRIPAQVRTYAENILQGNVL